MTPATPAPADGAPGERVSAHPFVRCPRCGQCDTGQTGEYPCSECGLPTVWDDVADASDCSDALEVAVAEYGMAAYHAKGQGFNDPAVSAAAARVFMSHRAAVAEAEAVAARLYATPAPLPAPSASAGVGADGATFPALLYRIQGGMSDDAADAVRMAVQRHHDRLVREAVSRGRAEALREVDEACDKLAGADEHEAIALWRIAPDRWRAEVAGAESGAVGVGLTATGAILDLLDCDRAAVDMAAHLDALAPDAAPESEAQS